MRFCMVLGYKYNTTYYMYTLDCCTFGKYILQLLTYLEEITILFYVLNSCALNISSSHAKNPRTREKKSSLALPAHEFEHSFCFSIFCCPETEKKIRSQKAICIHNRFSPVNYERFCSRLKNKCIFSRFQGKK